MANPSIGRRAGTSKGSEHENGHRYILTSGNVSRAGDSYRHGGTTSRAIALATTATSASAASQRINDSMTHFSSPTLRQKKAGKTPWKRQGQRDEGQRDRGHQSEHRVEQVR